VPAVHRLTVARFSNERNLVQMSQVLRLQHISSVSGGASLELLPSAFGKKPPSHFHRTEWGIRRTRLLEKLVAKWVDYDECTSLGSGFSRSFGHNRGWAWTPKNEQSHPPTSWTSTAYRLGVSELVALLALGDVDDLRSAT
jgi:hypothetical protein